jgi:thymidylate synthase
VSTRENLITEIKVLKGAPCGATWNAARKIRDIPIEKALTQFGLEVQFFCSANPASWDPLWGKSPVHIAADIHSAVLKAALKKHKAQKD